MMESGLAFVISHLDVDGDLPVELCAENSFRRANEQEIESIQKRLDAISLHGMARHPSPYRHLVREERHDGTVKYFFEELPKEKWKYWVIAFNGTNQKVHEIERAATLLPTDFDIGMTLFFSKPNQQGDLSGWSSVPLHLIERYSDFPERTANAKKLATADLRRIPEILSGLKGLPESASFVGHALQNYFSLRAIPRRSDLRVVGCFAIIESLVTHAPRLTETLDSINHQITNKLILLKKRLARSIPYDSYFLEVGEERLWKLLYAYRSCLAHGERADFKVKLQVLKNHDTVVSFLREIVKELILFGLREPTFLGDLKKC